MRSMESLLGAQEGRSGLKTGSPITKMSPGWFPPLGEGSEEQSQRQGQDKGLSTLLFSLPYAMGLRGSVTHQLLLSNMTQ